MTHIQFLSTPLRVRGNQVKNRIVVPPMADFGATDAAGLVNVVYRRGKMSRCQEKKKG